MSAFDYDKIPVTRDITRYIRDRMAGLPDGERDWADEPSAAHSHVSAAARVHDITVPYQPAEADVKTLLINILAGPKTAAFGWTLYAAYTSRLKLTDCQEYRY